MTTTSYTVLGDIEAVRKRPGMYAGDVSNPNHLATELLDNSLDEVANKFATKIDIRYDPETNSFWCSDNGRGIEIGEVLLPDGSKEDSIKALCTYLHSGSKFDNVDYNQLIGMHGVGLVVVNALSEWMIVKTRDRKNKTRVITYTFVNSEFQSREEDTDDDYSYSTIVGFKPNKEYFDSVEFDSSQFVERLIMVQSVFNLDHFTFNEKQIPKISFESLVKQYLELGDDDDLYKITFTKKNNNITVFTSYVEDDNTIIIGNVNLRTCDGKFLTSLQTEIKKIVASKIDKRFGKVSDREFLNGLRMYVLLGVPEPKFDSQTKVRMVLDVKRTLIDPIKANLERFVDNYIRIIEANLERKLHKAIINSNSKASAKSIKRVSADNKLQDCKYIPGEILYILEGDSAGGTLRQIRNKDNEAIYPLRGKVLNIETASLIQIKDNKEIQDLMEAFGPVKQRRYKYFKILADADLDGAHIVVLLIILFIKYAPDLIKAGRVSVVLPPLYGGEKGKKYVPIYEQSKVSEFKEKGFIVTRFKGLGEMNPSQLNECIRSGFEYKLKWPENESTVSNLISIITDTNIKRAIMDHDDIRMSIIMDEVNKQLNQKNEKTN